LRSAILAAMIRWILALLACVVAAAQPASQRPYVVLVSLDGFRSDYAQHYQARNILAIRARGASAGGMIPSFPSVTFPNHLSIVTGMYPDHHGIVANRFFDPARNEEYTMDRSSQLGSWLQAKPLWVLAEEQGIKTASMFWPMSDSEIAGVRPSFWQLYDAKFPNEQRVQKVLDWLKLPEAQRPHFITLYFSDVDTAGHDFGPDAPQTAEAVRRVDALIGRLWQGIQDTRLPVNLILVSDHGMQATPESLNLRDAADLTGMRVITSGPLAFVYTQDPERALRIFGKIPKIEVYRRQDTPRRWHFSENPRDGDLVLLAKGAVALITAPRSNPSKGQHGFDPALFPAMNAIFYAAGPNVNPGRRIRAFQNVHVFPFVAKILGIQPPSRLDGSASVLESLYRP
jgi:predicted AlkP superfamily pyrophosphatase or phosphodiesterase